MIERRRKTLIKEIFGNARDYQNKYTHQDEERYEDNIINEDNILIIPVLCEILYKNHRYMNSLCSFYNTTLKDCERRKKRMQL